MATANGDDGAAEAKVAEEEEAARVVIDLAGEAVEEEAGDQKAPVPKSQKAGKGPGKGPPLPKPQARRVVQISPETPETSATRSPSRFHIQRPQNCQRGGVLVMSSEPADRDLAILVRHLTDSGRHQKDVRIDMALLNLGRLRALRYERNLFNAATRPVDGQRFLEMCSSCGVVAGERPVKLEGLDDLINALEGEIEDPRRCTISPST
ncbi:unnamed protein product [Cladocopium goreaui]|uniref:ATPase family AAA domain-containing protein 3B n=1 Tax=Cladocopium goreaui TaxID=2562237 RepID=A0A9P1BP87_9DINO|nr:unnamed protein product [Cladocopium goreaui]